MLRNLQPSSARHVFFPVADPVQHAAQQYLLLTRKIPLSVLRTFSSTTFRIQSQQTSSPGPTDHPVPEYSFSIRPRPPSTGSDNQLRQSLRAWSVQNQRIKTSQYSSEFSYEGRITQLPSTIFVGKDKGEAHEHAEYSWTEIDEEASQSENPLQPGDLLYLASQVAGYGNAIYLGAIGIQSLFLTSSGKWSAETTAVKRRGAAVSHGYVVAEFLSPEEVESLRIHLPQQDITRSPRPGSPPSNFNVAGRLPDHIIRPFLNRLREYEEEQLRYKREYKFQLDRMYDTIALPDQWRRISLKDLPPLVIGQDFDLMTDAAKSAFVRHASACHSLIVPHAMAQTLEFIIGPKSLAKDMDLARTWARQYQEAAAQSALGKDVSALLNANPLSSFISKAQRLIRRSRRLRTVDEQNFLAPLNIPRHPSAPEKVPSDETFTDDDKAIINYLWNTSMRRPLSRLSEPQAALIVRAVGAYPKKQLTTHIVRLLLQELGCVDPWVSVQEMRLCLPGSRTAGSELNELASLANKSVHKFTDTASGMTKFPDSMAELREDWKEMEAFAIDTNTANFPEDAISIEPASELREAYWLHVHFSHIAARVDIDDPIVKLARRKGGTYFPIERLTKSLPMLPTEVASQSALIDRSPTLTVSTLLGTDGHVHDIKVTPTRLDNFVRLEPRAVRHALGFKDEVRYSILAVGKGSRPAELKQVDVEQLAEAEKYRQQLELIHRLLTARRMRRPTELETPASYTKISFKQNASVLAPGNDGADREHESYHWRGDPGIVLKTERKLPLGETVQESRADDIVAQSARLACESIGKWLADRHIPAIYLSTSTAAAFPLERLRIAKWNEERTLPLFVRSTRPLSFLPHNMKQYAFFSSPLREFPDLMNQFQVTGYLLAQAQGLIRAGEPISNESVLPHSRGDIEEYLSEDIGGSDILEDAPKKSRWHWTYLALYRAFHLKEAHLPEVFEVLVTQAYSHNAEGAISNAMGRLIPWFASVEFEESPEAFETQARFNHFMPVKILKVDLERMMISVQAIGPPTTEQQFLDPIEAYTDENFRYE